MVERSPSKTWFWAFFVIATIYGTALLVSGVIFLNDIAKYGGPHAWQEVSMAALLLLFLPLVLLGAIKPRLGSILLWSGAGLSLIQVLAVTRSTGDGLAGGLVGAIVFLGIPMALAALLFHRRALFLTT